jgi:lysophospholipase L1-like esterase
MIALAACGGPSAPGPAAPVAAPQPVTYGLLVGVGDSLTAGYQSSGFLGDVNPVTNPVSSYPGNVVPPGQFSGFWADMYNQMTKTPNAAAAVMPLIKGPGLGGQLVINATSLLATTHLSCDSFNQAAYSSTGWQSVRVNPAAGIADLGVPGITMHEAVSMTGPLTGPTTPNSAGTSCNGYNTIPGDPTSGGLQSLVAGESEMYYPVLGSFQGLGKGTTTELSAALSLAPKLTTVWLGANDLLKFTFSGGTFNASGGNPITDTPTQLGTDLTQIVTSLTKAGSKVLVADLPDILTTPQFFPQAKISADLQSLGIPAVAAGAIVSYLGSQYGITAGTAPNEGYLTETGFLTIVQTCQAYLAGKAPQSACLQPQLDPTGAGSGLGGAYLNPALATEVQQLNSGYNQVIDQIAAASGSTVALVPVHALFTQAAASGIAIAPGETMTLQFGGGLLSWDGLHPSNVGYAVIANAFITAANTAFGANITPLSAADLAAIANGGTLAIGTPVQADPYNSFAIKAINPAWPLPLP